MISKWSCPTSRPGRAISLKRWVCEILTSLVHNSDEVCELRLTAKEILKSIAPAKEEPDDVSITRGPGWLRRYFSTSL